LTVSGAVSVVNYNNQPLATTLAVYSMLSVGEVTLDANGEAELDPNGAKFVRVQNVSTNNMRLYAQDGFVLAPNGTEELTLAQSFFVYGTAGDKLVFGRFSA